MNTKKKYNWIYFDRTFCGNSQNCPRSQFCERALNDEEKKLIVGKLINYSSFYENGKECQHFIERRD